MTSIHNPRTGVGTREDSDEPCVDISELGRRGWTRDLVKKLLGDPDRWDPVLHWKNYRGKRMYSLTRVERFECAVEFEVSLARRNLSASETEQIRIARARS